MFRWIIYVVVSAGILLGLLSVGAFVIVAVGTVLLIAAGGCAVFFVAFLIKEWYEARLKAKEKLHSENSD
jgi:flagellar motor component MotA